MEDLPHFLMRLKWPAQPVIRNTAFAAITDGGRWQAEREQDARQRCLTDGECRFLFVLSRRGARPDLPALPFSSLLAARYEDLSAQASSDDVRTGLRAALAPRAINYREFRRQEAGGQAAPASLSPYSRSPLRMTRFPRARAGEIDPLALHF